MNIPDTALSLRDIDLLFRPFVHRKIHLPTRLVLAPVAGQRSHAGVPADSMRLFYIRRATHEMGLIITEAAAVAPPPPDSGMPHFFGGAALRVWKGIARVVQACGCRIAPLLTHCGQNVAGMSAADIRAAVQAFAQAAAHARILGFDAVVIDGTMPGLLGQFLNAEQNHRHDEYGGDQEARLRLPCTVLHAVRKAVGRRFPVVFRLEQRGVETPAVLETLLQHLCEAGVDIFDCADSGLHLPAFHGSPLGFASWVRMLSQRPVIAELASGMQADFLSRLAQSLLTREFELVAVGRALQADADWGHKVRLGREGTILP